MHELIIGHILQQVKKTDIKYSNQLFYIYCFMFGFTVRQIQCRLDVHTHIAERRIVGIFP